MKRLRRKKNSAAISPALMPRARSRIDLRLSIFKRSRPLYRVHYSNGCVAVPELGNMSGRRYAIQYREHFSLYDFGIAAGQSIGSFGHRDRPFGILAQGDTRNAQSRGLFLNSAAVG